MLGPYMDLTADGGCVSHAYTHLGFLEGPKFKVEQEMWQMDARFKKLEENLGFILPF